MLLQCKAFLFSAHTSVKSVVLMNASCERFEVCSETIRIRVETGGMEEKLKSKQAHET